MLDGAWGGLWELPE